MRRTFAGLVGLLVILAGGVAPAAEQTAYDFQFEAVEGGPLALADHRGKAILVVNTASQCGFTPQYADLQRAWTDYRDRGLVVVGVPSNDFGQQKETGTGIKQFCESYFGVDFPLADQTRVKGKDAHPFYRWALQELGPDAGPRWNFYKYLVGRDGHLVGWFPSDTRPQDPALRQAIETALAKK